MSRTAHPDDIARQLQRIGMSGYEAKAYLALVAAGGPLNGYEVAKRSGVPRSTVYETLRKLVSRGFAYEVRAEDGIAYLPLQPEGLLDRLRREFEDSASLLESSLPAVTAPPEATVMHHIRGRQGVLDRVDDMIRGARDDLWLSLWPEEADELADSLGEAEARGVEVFLLVFDEQPHPRLSHSYPHRFLGPEAVLDRVGCRLLVAVADRRRAIIGGAAGADVWAVYSEDPAVILVCVEYIRHDISYQSVCARIGADELEELFREEDEVLQLITTKGSPVLRT